jgi:glutathione S-transferase
MMLMLYHHPSCPFSRAIRLILQEKRLDFALRVENDWERRPAFSALNSAGEVPVLVDGKHPPIAEFWSIIEYLEEAYTDVPLLDRKDIDRRAHERRITSWFARKFYNEVTGYILKERVLRYYLRQGAPNSESIRVAKTNIHYHMRYLAFLLEDKRWLMGERITIADLTAAGQLSILDYLGDVPWDSHLQVKEWYILLKSRPSFKPLLQDVLLGFPPSAHYAMLDF